MHFLPDHVFDYGRKAWRESPEKTRDALKRVILTKRSKNFIKAKLTVSKSCLLGLLCFMIFCILRDGLILITKYISSESSSCHFLLLHNPFMISYHILSPVLDHELMLDNFLIASSVIHGLRELITCYFVSMLAR